MSGWDYAAVIVPCLLGATAFVAGALWQDVKARIRRSKVDAAYDDARRILVPRVLFGPCEECGVPADDCPPSGCCMTCRNSMRAHRPLTLDEQARQHARQLLEEYCRRGIAQLDQWRRQA